MKWLKKLWFGTGNELEPVEKVLTDEERLKESLARTNQSQWLTDLLDEDEKIKAEKTEAKSMVERYREADEKNAKIIAQMKKTKEENKKALLMPAPEKYVGEIDKKIEFLPKNIVSLENFIKELLSGVYSVDTCDSENVLCFSIKLESEINAFISVDPDRSDFYISNSVLGAISFSENTGSFFGGSNFEGLFLDYGFSWFHTLIQRCSQSVLEATAEERRNLEYISLQDAENDIGLFDKTRHDYSYTEMKRRETSDSVLFYEEESIDNAGFEADYKAHQQEIFDRNLEITEEQNESNLRIMFLTRSLVDLKESKDMFEKIFFKSYSKSKNIARRVLVSGRVFDIKDSEGNLYDFKYVKGKSKIKLKSKPKKSFRDDFDIRAKQNLKEGVVVTCLVGMPQISKLERVKNDLCDYYGADSNIVEFHPQGNSVYIDFTGASGELAKLPEMVEATNEIYEKSHFTLGIDGGGDFVNMPISDLGHTLIAGTSGFGKSVLQNVLIGALYNSIEEIEHLYLIDFKGGVEFFPYANIEGEKQTVVDSVEEFAKVAELLIETMNERLEYMKNNQLKMYNGKTIFAFLDEYAFIESLRTSDKKLYAEVSNAVKELTQKARAAKIYLVYGVQKATTKELPSFLKDNCNTKIMFKVPNALSASNIMGEDWKDTEIRSSKLGRGEFVISHDNEVTVIKSPYISQDQLNDFVKWCSECVAER